jgi:hypothetical protein
MMVVPFQDDPIWQRHGHRVDTRFPELGRTSSVDTHGSGQPAYYFKEVASSAGSPDCRHLKLNHNSFVLKELAREMLSSYTLLFLILDTRGQTGEYILEGSTGCSCPSLYEGSA